jgi:DNA-directed RNA polymerase subunit beta'
VIKVESQYLEGAITNGERYNKVIAIWSEATEDIANAMFSEMERSTRTAGSSTRSTSWPTPGARQQTADPAAGRHARPDGQAVGRDHRDADHVELP